MGEALQVARDACGYLSGPVSWDTLGSAHYNLAGSSRCAVTAHFGNDPRQAWGGCRPDRGPRTCHSWVAARAVWPGFTARTETLLTPYLALALRAWSEMNS